MISRFKNTIYSSVIFALILIVVFPASTQLFSNVSQNDISGVITSYWVDGGDAGVEGEVVNLERETIKGIYEVDEQVDFPVEIKNTGNVDGTFWVRYMFLSPGATATTYYGSPETVYVNSDDTVPKLLSWTVPNDASAGAYSLFVYLYDGDPDDPETTTLDIEFIPCALMIDRDISYIQIETISSITGEQRAIHVHIADHDVVKSGTLTFKVLISAFQLAKLAVGTGGSSYLGMLGRGFNAIRTIWGISNRAAKLATDGTADILVLQFIGDVGFLYEASLLDIGSIVWPVTPTPIPKKYLEMPSPYFSEIQFEWTIVSYMPAMEKYFPYWKFSKNEQWYPCSFYFDNNVNVGDNKDKYGKAEFNDPETGRPPYYVYIHVVMDADYLTVQYWMYYVYNHHYLFPDHMHDWDSRVYIIFSRDNLETPIKVGFSYHSWPGSKEPISYIRDWTDSDLEKVNNHIIAYVAEDSHGAYHQLRGILPEPYLFAWDTWEAGGITLGVENLTNWVIVGNCEQETILPESGGEIFCDVEYTDFNCVHPVPNQAIKADDIYWPKNFGDVDAAWHQDCVWRNTIPPWPHFLMVAAHSPVNLQVKDALGHSVGVDENGVIRYEIPDSIYTGPDTDPEVIMIDNPSGEYAVYVYGVENGTYDLEMSHFSEEAVSIIGNFSDVSIQQGQTNIYEYLCPVSFNVIFNEIPYKITILGNSTINGFNFNQSVRQINFNVTGIDGTAGFCNVTLPKNLTDSPWKGNWTVTVDGFPPILATETTNATHIFLYFTYYHSSRALTVALEVIDTTPPVANAGQDQTVNAGTIVTFDASGSSDNVGIVSYEWDF